MGLDSLYQKIILEHYRNPHNFRTETSCPTSSFLSVERENPACGDTIRVFFQIQEDRIETAQFYGSGCAIATASASMMTDAIQGKNFQDARQIITEILSAMTGKCLPDTLEKYRDLKVFQGIVQFPVRVQCAILAWNAAQEALFSQMPNFKR